jgi:hypothetical protein
VEKTAVWHGTTALSQRNKSSSEFVGDAVAMGDICSGVSVGRLTSIGTTGPQAENKVTNNISVINVRIVFISLLLLDRTKPRRQLFQNPKALIWEASTFKDFFVSCS